VFTTGPAVVFISIAFGMMDDTWRLTLYGIGGFAFNILAFVLPAVYYLEQFHFTPVKWGVAALLILVLWLFMAACSAYRMVIGAIEVYAGGE
jgi:hypothetical protein